MAKSRVILREFSESMINRAVAESLDLCEWKSWLPADGTVVLKPNLCAVSPEVAGAANTDVRLVAALCEALLSRTRNIYVGEADHMRQTAEEGFEVSGYVAMARKHGVQLVNFSKLPTSRVSCPPAGEMELPKLLLEADAFITLPVLKTHALTYFTGALKNQWGCVPGYRDRIREHRRINRLLATLHRIFHPQMALMDAIVGMEARGPVYGRPRRLNLILASRDAVALDASAMRLVGLEPRRARHVALAAEDGLGEIDEDKIEWDGDWQKFRVQFEPAPKDRVNWAMFQLSRYSWFVDGVIGNDRVYNACRALVQTLRKVGAIPS